MHLFSRASLPGIQALKKGKSLEQGIALKCLEKGIALYHTKMVKPVRKRAKGAGNSNPTKRKSFPEVDQTLLVDKLDSYVGQMGKEQAFNLLEYTHLQPQQAEVPRAMAKLAKLLECLLQASPPAQIKYCALKMGLHDE